MKSKQAEENYARFSANPDRIDGAVHNTATARLGVGFNYSAMEQIDAVEIAFANEPHGNMRSVMVVDMAAAKACATGWTPSLPSRRRTRAAPGGTAPRPTR